MITSIDPESILGKIQLSCMIKTLRGTSLVVQGLGIHLPVQRTQVRSLVWGDPTCLQATKPVCHRLESLSPAMKSLHSLNKTKTNRTLREMETEGTSST